MALAAYYSLELLVLFMSPASASEARQMNEHQVFAIYGAMVWSAPDERDFLRSKLAVGLLLLAICLLVLF